MKLNVYAVFDHKSNLFMDFFRANADGVALRMLTDAVNNPQSVLAKHPEDYSLYKLATFDDEKGLFDNLIPPQNLVTVGSLVVPK